MKRTLTVISFILFVSLILNASFMGRLSISEELSYQKYNKIWESPDIQYFSVESIASNPTISSSFDYIFGEVFGLTVGTEFGYQTSIEDRNRFVSFPKNINGTIGTGIVIKINSVRISIEALLRSSFQLTRNVWISQIGGKAGVSYVFPFGLSLDLNYKYLNSYRMITSAFTVGMGYQFGGIK